MSTKRELYAQARSGLKSSDRGGWQAAQAMSELHEQGETQAAIAGELSVSQQLVSQYCRVWVTYGDYHVRSRPLFSEALREVRGGWGNEPVTATKRAEIAADYLKDREVWKAPEVKAAIKTNVRKDVREETRDQFKPANGAVTRIGPGDWRWLLAQMRNCEDAIKNGSRDVRQGGMPARHAGELIKQARRLAAAAAKLEELLSDTAVGRPA